MDAKSNHNESLRGHEASSAPFFTLIMYAHDEPLAIGRAISTLLAQTFADFELIIVDDAAINKTVLQALRAIRSDERVKFIHNDEALGHARSFNRALERAKGNYMGFPMSLDFTDPDYLQGVYDAIMRYEQEDKTSPDIVVEGVTDDHYNHKKKFAFSEHRKLQGELITGDAVRPAILDLAEKNLLSSLYAMFLRREFVGSTRFEVKDERFDPFFFIVELLERADSLALIDKASYHFEHYVYDEPRLEKTADPFFIKHRRIAVLHDLFERMGMLTDEAHERLGSLYAEAVSQELLRITNPDLNVAREGQKKWAEYLYQDPLFIEYIERNDHKPTFSKSRHNAFKKLLASKNTDKIVRRAHLVGYAKSFGPEHRSRRSQ